MTVSVFHPCSWQQNMASYLLPKRLSDAPLQTSTYPLALVVNSYQEDLEVQSTLTSSSLTQLPSDVMIQRYSPQFICWNIISIKRWGVQEMEMEMKVLTNEISRSLNEPFCAAAVWAQTEADGKRNRPSPDTAPAAVLILGCSPSRTVRNSFLLL